MKLFHEVVQVTEIYHYQFLSICPHFPHFQISKICRCAECWNWNQLVMFPEHVMENKL